MKTITIKTSTINSAAESAGMTAEKFISTMRSISLGRKVCAHLVRVEGLYSVFVCA